MAAIQIKTKKRNEIPLCIKAREIIEKYEFRKGEYEFVFNSISNQRVNINLKKIAVLANLNKHLTFHVSRHSCASNLAENNIGLVAIRDILGHSSIKETQRYAKVSSIALKNAVSIFDSVLVL